MLHDVWFYGISAKRYCLYKEEGDKITILKHSSHALVGITGMPKGWEKGFWEDIVKYDKGIVKDDYIESKYSNYVVAGRLAITHPNMLNCVRKLDTPTHRMKAFNFVTVGVGYRVDPKTREAVIPVVPYTKDADAVRYRPFIDKHTGRLHSEHTEQYWKPMPKLFYEYLNHAESKFDGNIGTLQHKHINIVDIDYIGKESNNLERAEVTGIEEDDFVYYKKNSNETMAKYLQMLTKEEALQKHISKWEYNYIKRCLKHGKIPKLKKKTQRLLGLL